jgi:hypothetical protein
MEKRETLFIALTALIALFVVWATNAMGVMELGPLVILLLMCGTGVGYMLLDRWMTFEGEKAPARFSLTLLLALIFTSLWLGAGSFAFRSIALLFVIFALIPPISLYVRGHFVRK